MDDDTRMNEDIDQLNKILELNDYELSRSLLERSNWDISQAIENHFNSSTSSGNDIVNETPFYSISQVGLGLARSPIFLALNLIKGILWLTLRILRLPLWLFEYATRPSIEYIPPLREPNDCNRLLVQSIEESVNSCYPTSSSTSTSTTIASNLNSRKPISLPSFFVGTYNDAMREVKENAQFGIFGFVKSGNEEDCQFKANVLANDQFKNILNEHDCLIWIGDVNENKDAFNAAKSLGVTSFPFVTFHSLQAMPSNSSSSPFRSTPKLCHFSSHTSGDLRDTEAFINNLKNRHLNRISPYLRRLRHEKYERQRRVYAQEMKENEENEKLKADARRVLEARRKLKEQEEEAIAKQKIIEKEENERLSKEELKMKWKKWAKVNIFPEEDSQGIRLAFKLPDGRRVIRKFNPDTKLNILYTFIECFDVNLDEIVNDSDIDDYIHHFDFKMFTSYPRQYIPNDFYKSLKDFKGLENGGNVAIESLNNNVSSSDEEDE